MNAATTIPIGPGLKGPADGLLDAILDCESLNCEVICDLVHVAQSHIRLAAQRLGPHRFLAITDSLPGAGMSPGQYAMLDGRIYTTDDGAARFDFQRHPGRQRFDHEPGIRQPGRNTAASTPTTAAKYTSTNAAPRP